MKMSRTRIARTVADTTLSQGESKEYARHIAAYLLQEDRVKELDSLLRDIQADWAQHGYVEVIARSAHPLTNDIRTDIKNQVRKLYPQAHEIIVTELADAAIIGGLQISVANQQLDLSVEAKLNRFKQLTGAGKD